MKYLFMDAGFAFSLMNIHDFDLSREQLSCVADRWHAASSWAHDDHEHRAFVAVGGFNLNTTSTAEYMRPLAGQAVRTAERYRQRPPTMECDVR